MSVHPEFVILGRARTAAGPPYSPLVAFGTGQDASHLLGCPKDMLPPDIQYMGLAEADCTVCGFYGFGGGYSAFPDNGSNYPPGYYMVKWAGGCWYRYPNIFLLTKADIGIGWDGLYNGMPVDPASANSWCCLRVIFNGPAGLTEAPFPDPPGIYHPTKQHLIDQLLTVNPNDGYGMSTGLYGGAGFTGIPGSGINHQAMPLGPQPDYLEYIRTVPEDLHGFAQGCFILTTFAHYGGPINIGFWSSSLNYAGNGTPPPTFALYGCTARPILVITQIYQRWYNYNGVFQGASMSVLGTITSPFGFDGVVEISGGGISGTPSYAISSKVLAIVSHTFQFPTATGSPEIIFPAIRTRDGVFGAAPGQSFDLTPRMRVLTARWFGGGFSVDGSNLSPVVTGSVRVSLLTIWMFNQAWTLPLSSLLSGGTTRNCRVIISATVEGSPRRIWDENVGPPYPLQYEFTAGGIPLGTMEPENWDINNPPVTSPLCFVECPLADVGKPVTFHFTFMDNYDGTHSFTFPADPSHTLILTMP